MQKDTHSVEKRLGDFSSRHQKFLRNVNRAKEVESDEKRKTGCQLIESIPRGRQIKRLRYLEQTQRNHVEVVRNSVSTAAARKDGETRFPDFTS